MSTTYFFICKVNQFRAKLTFSDPLLGRYITLAFLEVIWRFFVGRQFRA